MHGQLLDHLLRYRYWYTLLGSLLSSLILTYQRVVINNDAVVYLHAAETFLSEGLNAAISINPNAFLPILIASLNQLTGLSLLASADLVNSLLHASLAISFLYLVRQMGGCAITQGIAAILILLHPGLIGFKEVIIRDPGYWAGCLISLGLFIEYERSPSLKTAHLWFLCIFVSALFRPEAIIFSLVPAALLFQRTFPLKERLYRLLPFIGIAVTGGAIVLLALLVIGKLHLLTEAIQHITRYINYTSLTSVEFDGLTTVWQMIQEFISSLAGAFSWPLLCIFAWCFYKKFRPAPHFSVKAYMTLSMLVILVFLTLTFFLTTRYATLFSLIVLATLPFSLKLLHEGSTLSVKQLTGIYSFVLVLLIDSFVSFGHSRAYLTEGIDWIHNNTPEDSRVMTNERKLTYSINRAKDYNDSEAVYGSWSTRNLPDILKSYHYFAEDIFWDEEDLMPQRNPKAQEVARFTSERGNRLVIYQLP